MKPVNINLVNKPNVWKKIFLVLAALLCFVAIGFTTINIYNYYANKKVMLAYQTRFEKVSKQSRQNRSIEEKTKVLTKDDEKKNQQELHYLKGIITKNMFPLVEVLTQIEILKPDQIDINSLLFSKNLKTVVIKGESNNISQVSLFLKKMNTSRDFVIELSKEEINEDKRIIFELIARWRSLDIEQKI